MEKLSVTVLQDMYNYIFTLFHLNDQSQKSKCNTYLLLFLARAQPDVRHEQWVKNFFAVRFALVCILVHVRQQVHCKSTLPSLTIANTSIITYKKYIRLSYIPRLSCAYLCISYASLLKLTQWLMNITGTVLGSDRRSEFNRCQNW